MEQQPAHPTMQPRRRCVHKRHRAEARAHSSGPQTSTRMLKLSYSGVFHRGRPRDHPCKAPPCQVLRDAWGRDLGRRWLTFPVHTQPKKWTEDRRRCSSMVKHRGRNAKDSVSDPSCDNSSLVLIISTFQLRKEQLTFRYAYDGFNFCMLYAVVTPRPRNDYATERSSRVSEPLMHD